MVKIATTRANLGANGSHEARGSIDELLPLEGSTSEVWKHFGFPGRNGKFVETDKKKRTNVCCKLCRKTMKYCGNTSSHLKRERKKDFQELLQAEAEKVKEKSDDSASSSQQPKIDQAFKDVVPIARNSNRWIQLTNSVCYFIGKDMQPFDTVNDPGFVKMLHTFEPRYFLPDRKTVATNYMPKIYEGEKKRVMGLVQSMNSRDHYAITTDLWTSRASGSGGGARGAEAPQTFRRQGQSPPINAFRDVISHNT